MQNLTKKPEERQRPVRKRQIFDTPVSVKFLTHRRSYFTIQEKKMRSIIIQVGDKSELFNAGTRISGLQYERPLTITIELQKKRRSNGQNSAQWVSLLADISDQVQIGEKKFSVSVWHEYLKELFLPEDFTDGETLKGYVKWQEMPSGVMKMVGSTTRLTTKGFGDYMDKCYAYGAGELGVKFLA